MRLTRKERKKERKKRRRSVALAVSTTYATASYLSQYIAEASRHGYGIAGCIKALLVTAAAACLAAVAMAAQLVWQPWL